MVMLTHCFDSVHSTQNVLRTHQITRMWQKEFHSTFTYSITVVCDPLCRAFDVNGVLVSPGTESTIFQKSRRLETAYFRRLRVI